MIDTVNVVNKLVAEKLDVSEDIVKVTNAFYWRFGVVESMRSGDHTAIRVGKVGTFMVSRRKLYRRIKKYISLIKALKSENVSEFKRVSKEERIEAYKADLRKLLARRNDIAKLYSRK